MKKKLRLLITVIVLVVAAVCVFSACGGGDDDDTPPSTPPDQPQGEKSLSYKLSDDGSFYIVAGIGTYTDSAVVIPSTYKGLPVKQIGGTENDEVGFAGAMITSVTVPDSVTVIGPGAFKQCTILSEINLPDTITSIGIDAFSGSAYYLDPENRKGGVLYVGKYLIELSAGYTGELVIKDGTILIADRSALDNVSYGITSVTVPSTLKYIGENAFYNCNSITTVKISDISAWCKIVFTNEYSNPATVSGGLNYGNASLTAITVPQGVTVINDYAFKGFRNLIQVTFPSTLTRIGSEAFCGCTALASINIPASVSVISELAFDGCASLEEIVLPDTLSFIGRRAFFSTGYFNNTASWDRDVLYIGKYLIEAKESVKDTYEIRSGTLGIACNAFYNGSVSAVIIPGSVRFIGIYAFYSCNNLKTVALPQSLKSIEYGTFEYCTSLESITIPQSVTVIGSEAFAYCSSLSAVNLSNGIVKIGDYSFYECVGLTAISLPASVVEIGASAFGCCTSLGVVDFAVKQGWSVEGQSLDVSSATENAKKLKLELVGRWKRA